MTVAIAAGLRCTVGMAHQVPTDAEDVASYADKLYLTGFVSLVPELGLDFTAGSAESDLCTGDAVCLSPCAMCDCHQRRTDGVRHAQYKRKADELGIDVADLYGDEENAPKCLIGLGSDAPGVDRTVPRDDDGDGTPDDTSGTGAHLERCARFCEVRAASPSVAFDTMARSDCRTRCALAGQRVQVHGAVVAGPVPLRQRLRHRRRRRRRRHPALDDGAGHRNLPEHRCVLKHRVRTLV